MSDRELIARLAHALRVQLDGVNLYSELLAEADALLARERDPDWRRSFTHENTRRPEGPPPLKLRREVGR
jgi:hypothetical protein